MADITMCTQFDCKLRKTCYRFNAPKSSYGQSYFGSDPRQINVDDKSKYCYYYWPMKNVDEEVDDGE